jgi:hypothetical protein
MSLAVRIASGLGPIVFRRPVETFTRLFTPPM